MRSLKRRVSDVVYRQLVAGETFDMPECTQMGDVLAREHAKGSVQTSKSADGGGRSVLTVRRPSPGNVSGRVKRDDRGRHESHLRRRRMGFGLRHENLLLAWT